MRHIKLRGTYYDIGLDNGRLLVSEKTKEFPPKFSQQNLERSKAYEEEVQTYCPGLLDELRGMAEGCKVDYQALVAFELTPFRLKPSCLVFAIAAEHTKSGKALFVRNHEWMEEEAQYLANCTVHPSGKLASYGFTFLWPLLSRYGGINEAGLAISSATASFENSGPGVMLNIATRWILDNFKTTDQAVEFIMEIPKVWGINYLVIDKKGTIAKIEAHRQKTHVTYPTKGFDFVTIAYDTPEMQKLVPNERQAAVLKMFETRKQFLTTWFQEHKGSITEQSAIDIMKDCDNQLHYHEKTSDGTLGTCWSWIVSPTSHQALISLGPPCKNEFKPYTIDYTFT
jgi:predicted choloylglycine hydrolase